MSRLFYDRPRLLVLALALIAVAGLAAFEVLPRYEDPELVSRNALVVTTWPGASAERVESQITDELEDELEEVGEVALVESVSRAGISIVSVELYESISETATVWSEVRGRVDDAAARFPPGAGEPEFRELTITAWTLQVALAWELDGAPNQAVLGRLAEDLADRLRGVPGTEEAERFGAPREEIAVDVDPARLATLGLEVDALARALARADAKVPAGRIDGARGELALEVEGEFDALERIAHVPVAAGADGALVRLGDLATLSRGVVDPPDQLAFSRGRTAVFVAARMRSGERADRWAARARAEVERVREELPAGVALEVVFDQSTYTAERLSGLFGNLALGAALVMVVILLSMGWKSALLVGTALPLSALMVLAGLRALDVPLHQMSVTGLIIALGLLIDNAIVMVDEVRQRLGEGDTPGEAVGHSVRVLAVPLLASTVTSVLAFLPLVIAEGGVGEFVGAMSLAVVLAVTSSFALALTVLPALAGWFERLVPAGEGAGWLAHGLSSERLARWWSAGLTGLYARPWLAIALGLVLPVGGLVLSRDLPEQFFPPAGRDQVQLELTLPDLASLARTREEVARADALLATHPAVRATHWVLGRSAPKFYYNQLESVEGAANYAGAQVQLVSSEDSLRVSRELQDLLDAGLPGVQALIKPLEQGPPFDAPVELIVTGPDLDVLRRTGDELRALLSELPAVTHTRATLEAGRARLAFAPRDEELERAGLDRVGLARRLEAALSGALGGSVREGSEELAVRVRLAPEQRAAAEDVRSLELAMDDGWTPLASLGEFELDREPARIAHRDGRRALEVHAFLRAGELPSDTLALAAPGLEALQLPPGYRLELGGEAAERDEAVGSLAASAGVLIVAMAATLVLAFRSFRMAAVIAVVALCSVGLARGALWTFGHPFGFMAIVGTLGLIGIAVNDSIVVLSALVADRDAARDPRAAAAVVGRATRHVLSTTVTTVAGFLPLLCASDGLWPPLAVAVAGGVLGATTLAVTLVPGAFVLLRRPRRARARVALGGATA